MSKCIKCGNVIPAIANIDGIDKTISRHRKTCLECTPWGKNSEKVNHICKNCGKEFPITIRDDKGRKVYLHTREYCLECCPFGERKFWGGKPSRKTRYDQNGKRILNSKTFICKICGKERTRKTRNNECSNCSNLRIRTERKNKSIVILGGKCEKCGYNKNITAFDFHHKNPDEKSFDLSGNWMRKNWQEIEDELKKCMLLCCRCHRELHDEINMAGCRNLVNEADLKSAALDRA